MELSLLLAQNIVSLALAGVAGYAVVKAKLLKSSDGKTLSTLIAYVFSPCMILNSFQVDYTPEKLKGLSLAFLVSVLIHILSIAVTQILQKPFRLNSMEMVSMIYTNGGYLIVPLVQAVFGTKWVFYTSAYVMVQTVFMWTHMKSVICEEKGADWRKIILNPNMITIAAGLVLFLSKMRLPVVFQTTVSSLAAMIGPACMLSIGMVIGSMKIRQIFLCKRAYLVSLFRLVIYPLGIILLMKISGIMGMHTDAKQIFLIVLLSSIAPTATMIAQLAQIYDRDAGYASILNVMTVFFCILTMPVMVLFYNWLI